MKRNIIAILLILIMQGCASLKYYEKQDLNNKFKTFVEYINN